MLKNTRETGVLNTVFRVEFVSLLTPVYGGRIKSKFRQL